MGAGLKEMEDLKLEIKGLKTFPWKGPSGIQEPVPEIVENSSKKQKNSIASRPGCPVSIQIYRLESPVSLHGIQ